MPPKRQVVKIGRNDACPCGSGKKYKKCCLGMATASPPTGSGHLPHSYPSLRELKAQPGQPMPHLSAYSLAKLMQKNDLSTLEPGMRRRVKELSQLAWSLQKVAAMETDDLEERLRSYGVDYSRERFLRLSEGLSSAWQLSEIWRTQDPVTCRGMDEDFLGFAACELWKRLLPERPSMERIDDWLEEGYEVLLEDECQACDCWWKAWRTLQPRFLPTMRTMMETSDVFQGTYLLPNWCQDFENWLLNAALHDRRFAAIGEQFCREWLAQFPGESPGLQVNFRRSWAEFTFKIGEVEQARTILEETLDAFPSDPWSYVALADAYSHLFADRLYHLPFDLEKANQYLQLGLQRPWKKADRTVLLERLDGLKEAVPVSDKPLRGGGKSVGPMPEHAQKATTQSHPSGP